LSDFRLGNLLYLENNYGLVLNYGTTEKDQAMALKSAATLLGRPGTKSNAARQSMKILEDHIGVTRFMVETIEQFDANVRKN
jgi:hypothetical protein